MKKINYKKAEFVIMPGKYTEAEVRDLCEFYNSGILPPGMMASTNFIGDGEYELVGVSDAYNREIIRERFFEMAIAGFVKRENFPR